MACSRSLVYRSGLSESLVFLRLISIPEFPFLPIALRARILFESLMKVCRYNQVFNVIQSCPCAGTLCNFHHFPTCRSHPAFLKKSFYLIFIYLTSVAFWVAFGEKLKIAFRLIIGYTWRFTGFLIDNQPKAFFGGMMFLLPLPPSGDVFRMECFKTIFTHRLKISISMLFYNSSRKCYSLVSSFFKHNVIG